MGSREKLNGTCGENGRGRGSRGVRVGERQQVSRFILYIGHDVIIHDDNKKKQLKGDPSSAVMPAIPRSVTVGYVLSRFRCQRSPVSALFPHNHACQLP
jgi:hypothetical protein